VTAPGRLRAEQVRRHGHRAAVTDMFTGESYAASAVTLPDPAGGASSVRAAGEHEWRQQWLADNDARVTRATRPVTLSWWERRNLIARGEDPYAWESRWNEASASLLLWRAGRLARDGSRFPIVTDPRPAVPTVPDLATRGDNKKEAAVANSIRTFADLNEPGIDPLNFAEELPDQLGEAYRLVSDRAEELGQEADRHRAEAEALSAYADYMEQAEVESGIASELRAAADAADGIARQLSEAASGMGDAAESVGSARRAAEAEYGDFKMPRFDRAG
ncbi:MAG: hypothetical protein L0I76_38170, partial [Pseudonocardia sp.]|nr:hypothetical protein [Pseudonocardia sp.]